jgi:protein-disulfide isomerase
MEKEISTITSKKWHQRWWGIIFLIILVLGFLYLAGLLYQVVYFTEQNQALRNQTASFLSNTNSSSIFKTPIETTDDPSLGPDDAIIKIVEFGDFQCPYCLEAFPTIKSLLANYPSDVKVIFRDFPYAVNHPDALNAALAANCAYEQGKFWQYHDLLFNNQSDLSVANLKLLANQVPLDATKFNDCFDSRKYLAEIQNDLQDGISLGITGTPTFFINGIKAPGLITYETFETIMQEVQKIRANNPAGQ